MLKKKKLTATAEINGCIVEQLKHRSRQKTHDISKHNGISVPEVSIQPRKRHENPQSTVVVRQFTQCGKNILGSYQEYLISPVFKLQFKLQFKKPIMDFSFKVFYSNYSAAILLNSSVKNKASLILD